MFDLTFTNTTKNKAFRGSFFNKIIYIAIEELRLSRNQIGLSINLVSNAKIQALNKKYRDKDKPTDILSFPLSTSVDAQNNKNAILELGDIFICPDVAVQKSNKNKTKIEDEMKFLTVHGFLHLLGYDHEKSKKAELEMFKLQDKILKKL